MFTLALVFANAHDSRYKLVKTTYECLEKAIAACKPGARYRDMGNIITKHAHSNGLSVVKTYVGCPRSLHLFMFTTLIPLPPTLQALTEPITLSTLIHTSVRLDQVQTVFRFYSPLCIFFQSGSQFI
jgi:hypothetical protein